MVRKALRVLAEEGAGALVNRVLGLLYRRGVRPILPQGPPARLGGVLTCYDCKWADRFVPAACLPWWMTDPAGNSRYEAALVSGLAEHVGAGDRVVVVGVVTAVNAAWRAGPSGHVTRFEGSRENCGLVRRAAALNGVGNLALVHATVGTAIAVYGSAAEAAPVMPPEHLPPCDVLELDCEGAEAEILRAMTIRPRILLVETHGVYGAPTAALMTKLGYAVSDRGWAEPGQVRTCIAHDIRVLCGIRADATSAPRESWRKRMGIEPTVRFGRTTGFEDQEGHQTPFASVDRSTIARWAVKPGALRRKGRDRPHGVDTPSRSFAETDS